MENRLFPPRLKAGSRVALIAPSSPVYEKAKRDAAQALLEGMGYRVLRGPSIDAQRGYLSGSDAIRAGDVERMFLDPSVDGVVCLRGGYGAARLLPLIDFERIAAQPKAFVGFSDITALHLALYRTCGLITFHGPMAGAGQPGAAQPGSLYDERIREAWLQAVEGRLPQRLRNPDGTFFSMLPGHEGAAEGVLLGGNLTVLCSLAGTKYLPDFQGKLLLLEDVGERPYRIDGMLTQLINSGRLRGVRGIVLGDFTNCEAEEKSRSLDLTDIFQELLPRDIPVIQGVHAGHGRDKITLPLGIRYRIDGRTAGLIPLEQGVEE